MDHFPGLSQSARPCPTLVAQPRKDIQYERELIMNLNSNQYIPQFLAAVEANQVYTRSTMMRLPTACKSGRPRWLMASNTGA